MPNLTYGWATLYVCGPGQCFLVHRPIEAWKELLKQSKGLAAQSQPNHPRAVCTWEVVPNGPFSFQTISIRRLHAFVLTPNAILLNSVILSKSKTYCLLDCWSCIFMLPSTVRVSMRILMPRLLPKPTTWKKTPFVPREWQNERYLERGPSMSPTRWDNPWCKAHDACLVKGELNLNQLKDSTGENDICFFRHPPSVFVVIWNDNHLKRLLPHTHHPCTCHWWKVGKWSHVLLKVKKKGAKGKKVG